MVKIYLVLPLWFLSPPHPHPKKKTKKNKIKIKTNKKIRHITNYKTNKQTRQIGVLIRKILFSFFLVGIRHSYHSIFAFVNNQNVRLKIMKCNKSCTPVFNWCTYLNFLYQNTLAIYTMPFWLCQIFAKQMSEKAS